MTAGALTDTAIADAARRRRRKRTALMWTARALTLLIILGGWELCADKKIIDPFFYGQPSGIFTQLKTWVEHGTAYGSIWLQIWVTLKEALLGFLYGVSGGIVLGVALGQFRFLADVFGPYIKIINALPRIVLGSIFFVAFGLGTTSKVLLASVLVFFVVFFNAFQGVREVDRNLVANARVLGASRWQVIRNVVLPSALVWIIASLHVAFGFSIIGAIVGEFLGAQKGLGLVISTSQNNFNPDGVFGAMVIIGVVALTAEALIAQLENRLLAWRPPSPNESGLA
ncbi:MAG: ABC transporter permease [Gaiellaceae bacterium]